MTAVWERFSEATRGWFTSVFAGPTRAQSEAWAAISSGEHALVVAPTGSGKTLAAFLWAIDRLASGPEAPAAAGPGGAPTRILYVSPLKALAADVERNLRVPLAGIAAAAERLGARPVDVSVGMRSGDSTPAERRRLVRTPPQILITTPESLYLMLTSKAGDTLTGVETVIVDEVHSIAGTKRGAHLALSLERLDSRLERPCRRVGLSATVRPPEVAARFLGGAAPVTVVAPPSRKRWDLTIDVPVPDLTAPPDAPEAGRGAAAVPGGLRPHIERRVADITSRARSTIVFVNSRGLAERLTAGVNAVAGDPGFARAHHGSVALSERRSIESALKSGALRCVVATSSLELGIDMGEVEQVVQVSAPPSTANAVQRFGRSGHGVGAVSTGILIPEHRVDLLHCAAAAARVRAGAIEPLEPLADPLDVLAQQTVAAAASTDALAIESWFAAVRRAAPFASLPRDVFDSVLDMLSGRYATDDFSRVRPLLVRDADAGTLTARPGAARIAVISGGTIPDRGTFTVYSPHTGGRSRVGELDEEMVYESHVGDVIALGASSWRITSITQDRVLVAPAPGRIGRAPFWHGDGPGRPSEFGAAIGAFTREYPCPTPVSTDHPALDAPGSTGAPPSPDSDPGGRAAENLTRLLAEQRGACGAVPTDDTLIVETFPDELGDLRVVLHSPYGRRVHAPWALAVAARLAAQAGVEARAAAFDDGIVLRLPAEHDPPGAELFTFSPEDIDRIVVDGLPGSALFAARFRECAARALLLPGRAPGKRSPLWQQRHRSAQLLGAVRRHPEFPILHETIRECLHDVYDMPALRTLLTRIEDGSVRIRGAHTSAPSPFASALLYDYLGTFIYDDDVPLAERRTAALALDPALLSQLLDDGGGAGGGARAPLDPRAIERIVDSLQWCAPGRRAGGPEALVDMLRLIGPLTTEQIAHRADGDHEAWLAALAEARRIFRYGHPDARWAVIEDAARLRDALGVPEPAALDPRLAEPVPDPLGDLVARYARTHGPFTASALADRLDLGPAAAEPVLERLAAEQRVVRGAFPTSGMVDGADAHAGTHTAPHGDGPPEEGRDRGAIRWCDVDVLHRLRRESLALARKDIEPVPPRVLGVFLPRRQGAAPPRRTPMAAAGPDDLYAIIDGLAGTALPASALETRILPARMPGYRPAMLDELTAAGDVLWTALGRVGERDGWIFLHTDTDTDPGTAPPTMRTPAPPPDTPLHRALLAELAGGGGYFYRHLADAIADAEAGDDASPRHDDGDVAAALWDLVWAGLVTGDTLAPLRGLLGSRARRTPRGPSRRRRRETAPPPRHAGRTHRAPRRTVPPEVAGRWALVPAPHPLPDADADATVRMHDAAHRLLDRFGIVTPAVAASEGIPGGFARLYRVLTRFEEAGLCRRGNFIADTPGPQFAAPGAADELRQLLADDSDEPLVLAAADPANPYGAALPWPEPAAEETHGRPSRGVGTLVVLIGGTPVVFVERGGRSLITLTDDHTLLVRALSALAADGPHSDGGETAPPGTARTAIDRIDGRTVHGNPRAQALADAGYRLTPRGYRSSR